MSSSEALPGSMTTQEMLREMEGIRDRDFQYGDTHVEAVAHDNRAALEKITDVLIQLLEDKLE